MSTRFYRVLVVFMLGASQISLGLPAAAARYEAVQADRSLPQVGPSPSAGQNVTQEDPLLQNIAAVAAGWYHTCALTTDGGVKCWGWNGYGQLGDGTTTQRSTPVNVSGLASGVTALAAGDGHTCALTTGGGVKCWGCERLRPTGRRHDQRAQHAGGCGRPGQRRRPPSGRRRAITPVR